MTSFSIGLGWDSSVDIDGSILLLDKEGKRFENISYLKKSLLIMQLFMVEIISQAKEMETMKSLLLILTKFLKNFTQSGP